MPIINNFYLFRLLNLGLRWGDKRGPIGTKCESES